jgi:large subunit ribosomal protein L14e
MAFEIGRVCVKLAGRDAGKKCVVVDVLDKGFVLIDGETRRRKVNSLHLEPLAQVVEISKGASTEACCKALGIEPRKSKPKKAGPKPRVKRKHVAPARKSAVAQKTGVATSPAKPMMKPAIPAVKTAAK